MKKILLYVIVCIMLCISVSKKAYAVNAYSNTETRAILFAVPDGGWSSMRAEITYSEKYTTNGGINTFNERSKTVQYKRGYVTSCPYISLYNVRHSNNNSFTTWYSTGVLFDPNAWDGAGNWINSVSVVYGANCGVVGILSYQIFCDGATIPVYSYSIQVTM